MPTNRPDSAELIESVREMMESLLLPAQTDKSLSYSTRVAINILKIVERDLKQASSLREIELGGLEDLLGETGDLAELNRQLVAKIRKGGYDQDNRALLEHFKGTVLGKIAIDNPNYSTYKNYLKSGEISAS